MRGYRAARNFSTSGKLVSSVAAMAALGACASTEMTAESDPYGKLAYVGAQQLYKHDRVAPLLAPSQYVGPEGALLAPVSYAGVEGAREAHDVYPEYVAEKLDGRCESRVRAASGESLADMSELCDVGMAKLVAYNPAVENPYQVTPGALLDIPGASGLAASAAGIASSSANLVGLYEVAPGETVTDVAARFNVSASTLLALNPDARWSAPAAGDQLRVPVPGAFSSARSGFGSSSPVIEPGDAAPNSSAAAPASAWVGYGGAGSPSIDEDALTARVEAHMPFASQPVDAVDPTEAKRLEASLQIDKAYVAEGDSVTVRLRAKPGEIVTFYRGKTTTSPDATRTVAANADGLATATFQTPKSADLGGYVFSATRESESDAYFSRRVGVVKR